MSLSRWQNGVLVTAGLAFLGSSFAFLGMLYRGLLAWQDMARDALARGNPVLQTAHLLPQFTVLGSLAVLSLCTAALVLVLRRVFAHPEQLARLHRPLTAAAWGCRLSLLLGPVLVVAAWLLSAATPNPLRGPLLSLPMQVIMAILGLALGSGPIMLLGWVGLGRWLGWTKRAAAWAEEPGRSGELHRAFVPLRLALAVGGGVFLGLFLWLLPEVMMGLNWGGNALTIQELFADQRQVIGDLFMLELLLGGLTLLVWRQAGQTLCSELDPQSSALFGHLHRTQTAGVARAEPV